MSSEDAFASSSSEPSHARSSEPLPRDSAREEIAGPRSSEARGDTRADARTDADDRGPSASGSGDDRFDWRRPENRRGNGRRGGRRRRRHRPQGAPDGAALLLDAPEALIDAIPGEDSSDGVPSLEGPALRESRAGEETSRATGESEGEPRRGGESREEPMPKEASGMFVLDIGGFGTLRQPETQFLPAKTNVFVPQRLIHQYKLRDGSLVSGRVTRGQKHKWALVDVHEIDGKKPNELKNTPVFKNLVTIDPDFHYAVGDATGEVSMRILDILAPIGRGQRALIVAPPRTGKTTILRQFANGITAGYPDVQLFVLLVDERPEEATDWRRSTKGQVFVSTSDESVKTHVQLAEAVWKRCTRLVELGHDVVLLLDSITRLARAYNNLAGGSGRTMSGGLDSRAMERPRQIFGSARNTEAAGSLTIIGTCLIDTGSRMDQLIFEEFKGTGNSEIVLSRKLADRRIFPALDIEKSGTRKEEKIIGLKRLKSIHTLRRVVTKMHFAEAMELLITKLSDVETNDEFLKRFEVDPEA